MSKDTTIYTLLPTIQCAVHCAINSRRSGIEIRSDNDRFRLALLVRLLGIELPGLYMMHWQESNFITVAIMNSRLRKEI